MEDWFRRDLQVLEAVGRLESSGNDRLDSQSLAEELGLDHDDVVRGLQALEDADFIVVASRSLNWVSFFGTHLLERGRRELRLWPADGYDALVAILELRIAEEAQPEERSKLESFLASVRSIGRDVAADVIGAAVKGAAGL